MLAVVSCDVVSMGVHLSPLYSGFYCSGCTPKSEGFIVNPWIVF